MGGSSPRSNPAAVPEDPPPTRPSFLSRFSLRSRGVRPVADFHIVPAEPHRKYAAGDHVEGHIILTIVKAIRITHLAVLLHGYVRVYKNPSAANEPAFNPLDTGSARFKYVGNGQASLFQDEQVLCPEGWLEPGKYKFGFDLLFPDKGLPSSIDFERGTISYMIQATLTRPAMTAPTQTCDRKICLVEPVDIGSLTPPHARTISLEPIPKKSRRRRPVPPEKSPVAADALETPATDWDSARAAENSNEGSVVAADDVSQEVQHSPRSPIPSDLQSEISGDSAVSASTGRSGKPSDPSPHPGSSSGSQTGGAPARTPTADERTITATIELQKGGCLRGDMIPVKISVQHIKRIKSMHGVVVTFFRQGRIDSSPPASLFAGLSKEETGRLEKDDYYPKSKAGLSGMLLTSVGSCSVFRKDLSQTFSPLIIDPVTLKSSVTASVRVPEDAFPTIRGVPGEMISFKYQVEVIVDLGGRLASLLQSSQSKGGPAPASVVVNPYEAGPGIASWTTSIVDTQQLRRQKGVISVAFEVVVGTLDSSRQRGRGWSRPEPSTYVQQVDASHVYPDDRKGGGGPQPEPEDGDYSREQERQLQQEAPYLLYPFERPPFPADDPPPHRPSFAPPPAPSQPSAPFYVPPPEVPDESGLSEKERIKRAEQRLLPSQPPPLAAAAAGCSSVSRVEEEEDIYGAEDAPPDPLPLDAGEGPSAPTLDDLASGRSRQHPTEDKQELERRRLLSEASAPPDFPDDYSAAPSALPAPPGDFTPSAPALTDEDDRQYGPNFTYQSVAGPSSRRPSAPAEQLPKYER